MTATEVEEIKEWGARLRPHVGFKVISDLGGRKRRQIHAEKPHGSRHDDRTACWIWATGHIMIASPVASSCPSPLLPSVPSPGDTLLAPTSEAGQGRRPAQTGNVQTVQSRASSSCGVAGGTGSKVASCSEAPGGLPRHCPARKDAWTWAPPTREAAASKSVRVRVQPGRGGGGDRGAIAAV